jgi:Asp-tRNA(Asn)/Glu-tRNA(Gln) amidotransferase A subunit family amidase
VVENVQSGDLEAAQVLLAYSRMALRAHRVTNCLAEIMIADAQQWAIECNKTGPLAGMPVSLKDTVGVAGWDSCIGYSASVGNPIQKDSAVVRLLKDAGAVPFVKTNVPVTLLSFETSNDVFGVTTNPHNAAYSPGGSSGGEGALLAFGGSRIGIGEDVGGSVRVPSHFSGTYTIKSSMNRFLKAGCVGSIPGQEGIPAIYSPMARTLEDLETFWKAVVSMKPWEYDHSVRIYLLETEPYVNLASFF